MAEWKDATNYKRQPDDTGEQYSMTVGGYKLYVTNNHADYRGVWTMQLIPVTRRPIVLHGDNADTAKVVSIDLAVRMLNKQAKEVIDAAEEFSRRG